MKIKLNEVKEDKEAFVREFGALLAKWGIQGVESMEYRKNCPYPYTHSENKVSEGVIVKFEGGGSKVADVSADSLQAIMTDVMRQTF
jgi:hypothetical protein